MTGLILDTGALIALERSNRRIALQLAEAAASGEPVTVPSGCLAQAWRDGRRQHRLVRLLRGPTTTVSVMDPMSARRVGELLGATGTSDVVDGHVAVLALRTGHVVFTSDPDAIRRLAPTARVLAT